MVYACAHALVGQLPYLPAPGRGLGAVAGYPEIVVVEPMPFQLVLIVVLIGVNNRFHSIMRLNSLEPLQGHAADFGMLLFHGLFADFQIEYRREVAFFERRVFNKKFHLLFHRRIDAEKMVCSTDDA